MHGRCHGTMSQLKKIKSQVEPLVKRVLSARMTATNTSNTSLSCLLGMQHASCRPRPVHVYEIQKAIKN